MIYESNLTSNKTNPSYFYRRDKFIYALKIAYTAKAKKNLPVYGIKSKDLREFTTTEKDLERGISRIPLQLSRLLEEDILDQQTESMIPTLLPSKDEETKGTGAKVDIARGKYYYIGVNRMTSTV